MFDAYLRAIRECDNWNDANLLARILPDIQELDDDQIAALVDAYNSNYEVYRSYGFNGQSSYKYGTGLLPHLHRLGSRRYEISGAPSYHIRLASTIKKRQRD